VTAAPFKLPLRVGWEDGSGMETIRDAAGTSLAVTNWGCSCCKDPHEPEHQARAEAIALAVNAHAGLVEALREMVARFGAHPTSAEYPCTTGNCSIERAKAALRAAGVEP
jgi:hypothetical protein